ncbi:exopolysaccharide production repressor protein [Mesorhizobium sp. AaZ16]|uniref:exopolysaccharide production repressor protein n=1 Tax=Mesorhizobium sp. AaZ16 TaxID=3402289 RepID=UPI00374E8D7C
MTFLLFLRGLILVLLVFGITTYVVTQSLWATFIRTVICAVLLQIGYFAAVLFLVWRSAGTRKIEESMAHEPEGSPDQRPGRQGRPV